MDGHSWDPESLKLVCGIPSRIWEGMAVTNFKLASDGRSDRRKRIVNPIPVWSRTSRWLAMPWQSIWIIFTERMGCSHWQRWCPYRKLAMERSKTDWMKTAGKQRFRGTKASPYAYLKFSPTIYISISIFNFCLFIIIIRKLHNHLISDWLRFTRWP